MLFRSTAVQKIEDTLQQHTTTLGGNLTVVQKIEDTLQQHTTTLGGSLTVVQKIEDTLQQHTTTLGGNLTAVQKIKDGLQRCGNHLEEQRTGLKEGTHQLQVETNRQQAISNGSQKVMDELKEWFDVTASLQQSGAEFWSVEYPIEDPPKGSGATAFSSSSSTTARESSQNGKPIMIRDKTGT